MLSVHVRRINFFGTTMRHDGPSRSHAPGRVVLGNRGLSVERGGTMLSDRDCLVGARPEMVVVRLLGQLGAVDVVVRLSGEADVARRYGWGLCDKMWSVVSWCRPPRAPPRFRSVSGRRCYASTMHSIVLRKRSGKNSTIFLELLYDGDYTKCRGVEKKCSPSIKLIKELSGVIVRCVTRCWIILWRK